jgi:putative endonuclease
MERQKLGKWGEKLAREYLEGQGYHILESNFRCRQGEIDIIAQDKDWLVFVEVRTRSSQQFGSPEESITSAKKEKLVSTALTYLQTHHNQSQLWRFDVVAIEIAPDGKSTRIELVRNAID